MAYRAVVGLSPEFEGQFKVWSDDPMFSMNVPDGQNLLLPSGDVMNQDRLAVVCGDLTKAGYEVSLTPEASERYRFLSDSSPVVTPSAPVPWEGFEQKRFQSRCIRSLKDVPRAMVQSACGTGKSFMGSFLLAYRFDMRYVDSAVVWCPSPLVSDWVRNIQTFTNLTVESVNPSWPIAKRERFYRESVVDVLVLNYERLRTKDAEFIFDRYKGRKVMFLMDECTKVKSRTSKVHRNMRKMVNHLKVENIVGLTATPIIRGPEDFYNEFRIIDPSKFGTVREFEHDFTFDDGAKDMWGAYIGYKDLEKMHLRVGSQVFCASKDQPEIAAEFPSKNEILVPLELSKAERDVYDAVFAYGDSLPPDERQSALFFLMFQRLCNMPERLLADIPYDPDTPYGVQAEKVLEICARYGSRLERSKNSNKLQFVTEKVGELLDAGEKVIVFGAHTHNCLFPLAGHLRERGFDPLLYTGESSEDERTRVRDLFKTTPNHNLLLMSDAGQMGLNFQECSNIIHYQTPTTHAAYEQRSDRVSRIDSQADFVNIYRMVTMGTVEERIEETMQERRRTSEQMGFGAEYSEFGAVSQADADFFCGFTASV